MSDVKGGRSTDRLAMSGGREPDAPARQALEYRMQLTLQAAIYAGIFGEKEPATIIIPTYHWLDGLHMLWDAFRDWVRELIFPTSHFRYDDSRPRRLASECICGDPGCTRWYRP